MLLSVPLMGAGPSATSYDQTRGIKIGSPFETDPAKGRDFREISVHPNSEELLIVECSRELEPTGGCYVLRYHLTAKTLQRYTLPDGYFYTTASFSPGGRYVLMTREQKTDGKEESVRQAHDNAEIVWVKTDGTEFKVLPLAKGLKVAPVMSPDETRVAYWRTTLRPPGSKTVASNFDLWEVNLSTWQDNLFAGAFHFFSRTNLQYLSQDEMLVGAYGPKAFAQSMFAYEKRYNHSEVYKILRGTSTLPAPILVEIDAAKQPSSDADGNIYFEGQRPGSSIFRKDTNGQLSQWVQPKDIALGGIFVLGVAPNGSFVVFTYGMQGLHPREGKRGIGLLNIRTSEWGGLNIPPLQSSRPITVKTGD